MDHLAILNKKLKLLDKIISGEKTIESRWYKSKKTPYNNIKSEDRVYFKESGEPVTVRSKVENALFFESLSKKKIISILEKYGKEICIPVSYSKNLTGKNFCILVFLKDVEKVKPFSIGKKGYGMMAAWITLSSISNVIPGKIQQ